MSTVVTHVGRSKSYFPIQERANITQADFALNAPVNLASLSKSAFNVSSNPYVDCWVACNNVGATLTAIFALFDENKNPVGVSDPLAFTSSVYQTGSGLYLGNSILTFDLGFATYAWPIITQVPSGTWNLWWRPYGWSVYPA